MISNAWRGATGNFDAADGVARIAREVAEAIREIRQLRAA